MPDTRAQISEIRALIQWAADLRTRGQEIRRQLASIRAEVSTLTAPYTRETFGPQQVPPTHSAGVWSAGNDGSDTPDSHK